MNIYIFKSLQHFLPINCKSQTPSPRKASRQNTLSFPLLEFERLRQNVLRKKLIFEWNHESEWEKNIKQVKVGTVNGNNVETSSNYYVK